MPPVTHSEVMQTAGSFHGLIGKPGLLVPKDVFDNPTPLHSGDDMFDPHPQPRQFAVAVFLRRRQLASGWLLFRLAGLLHRWLIALERCVLIQGGSGWVAQVLLVGDP